MRIGDTVYLKCVSYAHEGAADVLRLVLVTDDPDRRTEVYLNRNQAKLTGSVAVVQAIVTAVSSRPNGFMSIQVPRAIDGGEELNLAIHPSSVSEVAPHGLE